MKKALFDTFPNMDYAQELIQILEENNIEFSLVENAHDVDITFTGNKMSQIQLFLDTTKFSIVQQLRERQAEEQIDLNDKSHYLHEFNDEELYEILKKPDEWSNYDHAYSKKLLKSRGHEIDPEKIESLSEKRQEELAKPEKSSQLQIVAGYIFACLGGLLGIMIGWYIWKSTKTLSDGKKIFVYEQEDRQHAKTIAIIGITMTSLIIIIRIGIFLQG